MEENKFITLAKKLKALADQGVGGEKENAVVKLKAFMEKHSITMEDLEGVKMERFPFTVKKEQQQLFFQVALNVIGNRAKTYWTLRNKRSCLKLECTQAEAIEIELKFRHYWKGYSDELKVFFHAFVQRNNIYNIDSSDSEDRKPTDEEISFARRVLKMANTVKGVSIHKELQ